MQNGVRRDFGNGTDVALRRFRTQSELRADGIAGAGMWGRLLGHKIWHVVVTLKHAKMGVNGIG